MTRAHHSLRGRIVLAIVSSVIATSVIFGLATFAIAYAMEDRMFRNALAEEVALQQANWQRTGLLSKAKIPNVSIHRDKRTLPADIQQEFEENLQQTEFYGREGRHYHVERFDLSNGIPRAAAEPAIAVIEVSDDLLVRPYRDSMIQLLIGIGVSIATIMALFGWWLANRAMRPLSRLAEDVANADSAIPVVHAGTYPSNEIGLLAGTLEQAFNRIRRFVEREQAFTRDASHELRTPLAVIRGATEVIGLNRSLPSPIVEPLRRIENAATDMALALDQLLALAREGKGEPTERVELRPMVEKAISSAQVRFPDRSLNVTVNVPPNAKALVHPTSLQLVLNNLIGNCFQHVGDGALSIDFDDFCLTIADDGPGFESIADPFTPFARGSASNGSGLGLDISRRLCEAADIELTSFKSNDERGAHFSLRFTKPC